jgi:hypothetical protein
MIGRRPYAAFGNNSDIAAVRAAIRAAVAVLV